ncbi:hypothetical protein [Chitinivorax sp. B]|uniref:hypothetical protein n=1 Tax=Chitinivorax sp. B TaxID=2502235 RepID=UPI0010F894D9|nr:hypothetical protein [Chitinivorax sp. B]
MIDALMPEALQSLATVTHSHMIKAALAADRLTRRFPDWDVERWTQLIDHAEWQGRSTVACLLHETVRASQTYSVQQAERVIARRLFPLAYRAGRDWYDAEGLHAMIHHYASRASNEPGYLGHGFSIWWSFVEAEQQITDEIQRLWLMERFVEMAAQSFPGFPPGHPDWIPPAWVAHGNVSLTSAWQVCLQRPGWYGHHLLSLAGLSRAQAGLAPEHWQRALETLVAKAQRQYLDPADNVLVLPDDIPEQPWSDDEWGGNLLAFSLAMRANIHALTLADALATLWDEATSIQRCGLQGAMARLLMAV